MNKAAAAIKKIANQDDVKLHACKVDAINASRCDVTPLNDAAPLKDVRLNADITKDLGIVITPKVNSIVLVNEVSKTDAYVSMFSEIESINIKIGNTTAILKDGEISFNGGNLGGLVKVQELTKKIIALETAMDTHIHSGGTANGMTGTVTPPKFPVKTQKSQLENTKVKH